MAGVSKEEVVRIVVTIAFFSTCIALLVSSNMLPDGSSYCVLDHPSLILANLAVTAMAFSVVAIPYYIAARNKCLPRVSYGGAGVLAGLFLGIVVNLGFGIWFGTLAEAWFIAILAGAIGGPIFGYACADAFYVFVADRRPKEMAITVFWWFLAILTVSTPGLFPCL